MRSFTLSFWSRLRSTKLFVITKSSFLSSCSCSSKTCSIFVKVLAFELPLSEVSEIIKKKIYIYILLSFFQFIQLYKINIYKKKNV